MALGQGNSVDLNVVAVGSNAFTGTMWTTVDQIVHRTREIYAQIGIGVRIVRFAQVATADARGLDNITTSDEVDDLRDTWVVENSGTDLFVPAAWAPPDNLLGRSRQPGDCPGDKDEGAAVGIADPLLAPRSAAHEMGHYLSPDHSNALKTTLMCQTSAAVTPSWDAVAFTNDQAEDVREHCMVEQS